MAHVGPTHCLCGSHILFRWDPRAIQAGPTRYSGGTHVGPTRYSDGTHVGPTVLLSEPFYLKKLFSFHYLCYSGGTHVGPTRYSGGTHVGPTVLLSELFYLKKIIFLPLFDNTKYI